MRPAPQSVDQWLASVRERIRETDMIDRGAQSGWDGYRHYRRDRPLTAEERVAMYAERGRG